MTFVTAEDRAAIIRHRLEAAVLASSAVTDLVRYARHGEDPGDEGLETVQALAEALQRSIATLPEWAEDDDLRALHEACMAHRWGGK